MEKLTKPTVVDTEKQAVWAGRRGAITFAPPRRIAPTSRSTAMSRESMTKCTAIPVRITRSSSSKANAP